MIRRPRFLSPQERVKSPPTQVNLHLPRKQSLLMSTGPYVFDCSQIIGKGQYSVVYKGYEQNKPNQIVAVKVITIQPNNPIQKYMIENEINTLKLLDSPHILKLLYHNQNNKTVFLVTEFCNKGDLLQKLQRSLISEEEALQYTLQIAKALQNIHQHNIMHGDIKSANILLSDRCVLADFGFAQKIDQAQQTFIIGTPLYMAPEVLFENEINCQADIWSLGCVLYEMVYGLSPFYSDNNDILKNTLLKFKEHGKLSFPNTGVSKKIQALIQYLIRIDPNQRLTASETVSLLEPRNVDEQIKLNESQIKIKQELLNLDEKGALIQIPQQQQQQTNFNDSNINSNSQSNQTPIQDIQSTPENQKNTRDNTSQDEHRRSTKNSNSSAKRKKLLQQLNNINQRNINSQVNYNPSQQNQQQNTQNSDVKKFPLKNPQQINLTNNNNNNNNNSNNNSNNNNNNNSNNNNSNNNSNNNNNNNSNNNNSNNNNNNNNNPNPNNTSSNNKTISLLDLVNYFYKVYQLIRNGKEIKLAFIYLKLVNIYYLAYLEEQSKQQKKVVFVSCQNDYFELEREIKNKYPLWLKEEEFQKIFHSKFTLTQDFLRYSLNYLNKAAVDQQQDEKITDKIKKTLQIIQILVSNERSSTLQLDQQIIRLHRLNSKV